VKIDDAPIKRRHNRRRWGIGKRGRAASRDAVKAGRFNEQRSHYQRLGPKERRGVQKARPAWMVAA
jgi:hypothetical protein